MMTSTPAPGSVSTALARLASVFLLNTVLGGVLSLLNLYWIGRLDAAAQAAAAVAMNPLMVLLALASMVGVGTNVLVAQAVGGDRFGEASRVLTQAVVAALLVAACLGGPIWFYRFAIGIAVAGDARTAEQVASYLAWLIPAAVLQAPTTVIGCALGAMGKARVSTVVQLAALVLCATLSPMLIFGGFGAAPRGIEGAGLSACIASVSVLSGLLLYCAYARGPLALLWRNFFGSPSPIWQVLRIGLPSGARGIFSGAYFILITWLLRKLGSVEQAAFGVGFGVLQMAQLPLLALASAGSVFAAQSAGARSVQRFVATYRATLLLGLAACPLLLLLVDGAALPLCTLFSDDPAVVAASVRLLRIASLSLVPASVSLAAYGVLSGLGNTRARLLTTAVQASLVVVPALALSHTAQLRSDWLWELMLLASVAEMLLALHFARREIKHRFDLRESRLVPTGRIVDEQPSTAET
jgi:putative MATE family efflux protein